MRYPDPADMTDDRIEALIHFSKFSKSMDKFHHALIEEQHRRWMSERNEHDAAAQNADDRWTDAE